MTRQGGVKISQAQKGNNIIQAGASGITDINLVWATTARRAAPLVTTIIVRKKHHGVTRWEDARQKNIGLRMNDSVGRFKKKVAPT